MGFSKGVGKVLGFLPRLGRYCSLAYLTAILLCVAFVAPWLEYAYKSPLASYGPVFMLIAILLGGVLVFLVRLSGRTPIWEAVARPKVFTMVIVLGCLILFAVQFFIVKGAWFRSYYWDVSIMTNIPSEIDYSEYYSQCPNNLFLAGFFLILTEPFLAVGRNAAYLALMGGGCVCVTVSVGLTAFVAKALGGAKAGICAFMLAFVLLGCSPWIMVPYSDAYGILCPTVSLFLYVCVKNKWIKWPSIVFVSCIGYCVKPTAVLVLVAIVLVEVCMRASAWLRGQREVKGAGLVKRWGGVILCSLAALLLALGLADVVKGTVDIQIDENAAFGPAHYLMMGANPDTLGGYSPQDVLFSRSAKTKEDRIDQDIATWRLRIRDLGPDGIAKLLLQKSMTNYACGAFAWEREGITFDEIRGDNKNIKKFYDISYQSWTDCPEPLSPWAYIAQGIWFLILAGSALNWLRSKPSRAELIVSLTILMLSVFIMLFECRARYLFLYAPYFVTLGVLGWQAFGSRVTRLSIKHLARSA